MRIKAAFAAIGIAIAAFGFTGTAQAHDARGDHRGSHDRRWDNDRRWTNDRHWRGDRRWHRESRWKRHHRTRCWTEWRWNHRVRICR